MKIFSECNFSILKFLRGTSCNSQCLVAMTFFKKRLCGMFMSHIIHFPHNDCEKVILVMYEMKFRVWLLTLYIQQRDNGGRRAMPLGSLALINGTQSEALERLFMFISVHRKTVSHSVYIVARNIPLEDHFRGLYANCYARGDAHLIGD